MTTITIKQHGDVVFYLTSQGFQKGKVKTTSINSDRSSELRIRYFVNDDITAEFIGYEKSPQDIWDSYEEMLIHFQANPPA